jgi:MYXO-CTERM domain-containing protein
MRHRLAPIVASCALCLAPALTFAAPVTIGPAVNNTFTGIDGTGQRINIDNNNPIVLAPGTYTASQFTFFAVTAGSATQPILVKNSDLSTPNPGADIDAYSILAVGNSLNAAPTPGTNVVQNVPFGGSNTFTLAQTTKVFAGVVSGTVDNLSSNAIGFVNGGAVDHHNPTPTQFVPTVGGGIPSFTNPDLGRIYGFSITVDNAVPEPGAITLLAAAALPLLRRRIR